MKLPDMKRFRWNYTALAFLIPTGLMLVFMFITSCEPFGKHCMLYSDMYHQYYPFFCAFRRAILSGDSLLYSWNVGIGMEYLGLISYYLASPLNLISVLLPESWTLEYFSLLLPIKMGLASLFFAIMLKKLTGKNDLSIALFGSLYGMCAWAFGYNWNIMWMDTFALLPLVALGTVLLIRDRKFILYTVTLFLAIFSNYYIGFFVCIFVLFLFICYQICRFKNPLRTLEDFIRIGVFTVLAIGMTAILELPTLAALQDTQSSVNTFPDGFAVNIVTGDAVKAAQEAWAAFSAAKAEGLPIEELLPLLITALSTAFPPVLDAMKQVAGNMGATITPTYMDGLPNLYCGVFPIALACLFLLSGEVKLRDKLCCMALLLFFMVSFIFRQLDYIWHGFHFTNQIPYRFSFLFSFVLLYMAYRAWTLRDSFQVWQIIAAGAVGFCLLFITEEHRNDLVYMAVNLLFLGAYLTAMLYGHKELFKNCAEESLSEEEVPVLSDVEISPEGFSDVESSPESFSDAEASPEGFSDTELSPEEGPATMLAEEPADSEVCPEASIPQPQKKVFRFPSFEERQRQGALAIACLMAIELVLGLATFGSSFPVNQYDYPKKDPATASMIRVMKEREKYNLFYRAETTHSQILNDAALNDYNGLSTFTSSANVQVTSFAQALGFGAYKTWNRYLYEESSPVTAMFLNLKYMIERDNLTGGNSYLDYVHSYNGVTLLENNAYLPLGFLAENTLADLQFPSGSGGFTFQNNLFKAATGSKENVWYNLPSVALQFQAGDGLSINSANKYSGLVNFTTGENGGQITYEYAISQEGYLCLDLNLHSQRDFTVWLNGNQLYAENISLAQMSGVGDVVPGDVVQVVVNCNANTTSSITIKAAMLDEKAFREGYDVLNTSTLELTEFSNTYVSGEIVCNRDGLLYTSIPQCGNERIDDEETHKRTVHPEGNWSVYVDGKKADITLVGDCMIAVPLSKGAHAVEFIYENPSFELGWKVSAVCAAVFAVITLACYLPGYIIRQSKKRKQ